MTVSSTDNRYNRMNSYADETVMKASRELLRLGCHHGEIEVSQEGSDLKLVYDGSVLNINAFEALATLKGIRRPAQEKDIWAILSMTSRNNVS